VGFEFEYFALADYSEFFNSESGLSKSDDVSYMDYSIMFIHAPQVQPHIRFNASFIQLKVGRTNVVVALMVNQVKEPVLAVSHLLPVNDFD